MCAEKEKWLDSNPDVREKNSFGSGSGILVCTVSESPIRIRDPGLAGAWCKNQKGLVSNPDV